MEPEFTFCTVTAPEQSLASTDCMDVENFKDMEFLAGTNMKGMIPPPHALALNNRAK
jgi:hypothetical protein